jgi:hypothetical protein
MQGADWRHPGGVASGFSTAEALAEAVSRTSSGTSHFKRDVAQPG